MKVIKKNVYYCDYCKKKGLSSLKNHELHCTGNPNRECKLCETRTIINILTKFKNRFNVMEGWDELDEFGNIIAEITWKGKEITMNEITDSVDSCPNCVLTILRCVGLNRYYFKEKYKYNHQKEIQEWWAEKNHVDKEAEENSNWQ